VEGRSSLTLRDNHPHNGMNVIEHVASSDTENGKALSLQIRLTQLVNAHLITEFVCSAVDLN
jgi:hypothetical protein